MNNTYRLTMEPMSLNALINADLKCAALA
jgi:hypothetical protein